MNDIPRQKLKELIQRFGTSLSEDRLRCLGMLKDVCGEHKKEIAGIMAALDEKIPAEILKPDFSVAITRKLLIKKLEDNRAIAHEVAEWSVDTWAVALGVMTESQISAQVQTQPQLNAPPQVQSQVVRTPTPQPQSNPTATLQTPPQRLVTRRWLIFTGLTTAGAIGAVEISREPPKPQSRLTVREPSATPTPRVTLTPRATPTPRVTPTPRATPTPRVITPATPNPLIVPKLVRVAGGRFLMGSPSGVGFIDEHPQTEVTVRDFSMGETEVTVLQYLSLMERPSRLSIDFAGDDQPIVFVSWLDAKEYCSRLSDQTGQRYRLPSEAEWEYAARGGNRSRGFIFAGSNNLDEVGWYMGNSGDRTQPVGQKKANELGIYDMSGNVWEWCEDVWHDNYNGAPIDGSAWTAFGDQNRRVLRGGSWANPANHCRVTTRLNSTLDNMFNMGFGFRVVLS